MERIARLSARERSELFLETATEKATTSFIVEKDFCARWSIGSDQSSLTYPTDNKGNCHKRCAVIGLNSDIHTPKQDFKEEVSDAAQADHSESGE